MPDAILGRYTEVNILANDEHGEQQNATVSAARPRIVGLLGYGGLLPFLALGMLAFFDRERETFWQGNLRAYAAVILSFVGALHWGFATVLFDVAARKRNRMYAWSVVPSLLGFAALGINSVLSEPLLVVGFSLHYCQDLRLARTVALPAWYMPLRLRLSAVAILCLCIGAFASSR